MKKLTLTNKKKRPLGPPWLRLCLFFSASLSMGLAITAAMQWISIGTLPGVLEWAADYPGHLAMTALLWAVPVAVLRSEEHTSALQSH